jgi:AcrR family transcriptional regulator
MTAPTGQAVELPARERILEAACDLIAADGIDEVRIARVARRAGASTALVHHYFSTREDLLEQALLHSFDRVGDERFGDRRAERPPPGETATEKLGRLIDECLPLPGPQEQEWVLWVELWLRAVRDPSLRPVAIRLYGRYRAWIAAAIREGTASGEFAPTDPRALADRVIALLDGFGIRALLGDPVIDADRARREVTEMLARELAIAPKELVPG